MRPFRKLCIILAVLVPVSFLCFHSLMKSDKTVAVWNREAPEDVLDGNMLQPQDKYSNIPLKWKNEVLDLLPKNSCKCEVDATLDIPFREELIGKPWAVAFTTVVEPSNFEETFKRRDLEYKKFKTRSYNPTDKLIVAEANSPLQYPVQGVEVRPMNTIIIPGLSLLDRNQKNNYEVILSGTIGTFDVAAEVDSVTVKGAGEKQMILSSHLLDNLNRQLQLVSYTNTIFHPNTADIVQFQTEGHTATFAVKVRHPIVPKLYDAGPSNSKYNISALVTIATKTFIRYDKLQDLIDSIRKFYPTVTIIIADDNEKPQKIEGPYIEQYIMPFGKGWFAGRNLAISQVSTKYVLWVDDDFIFCARTKIEKLVDVLERTNLDIVGGAVREVTGYYTTYRKKINVQPGGSEGDCLYTHGGYHHVIEGYPNCVVADGVVNFFLGRKEKIQKVGFDPRLDRTGHLEFFVEGLRELHVGSCDDVIVDHASKIHLPWSRSPTDEKYSKFRYPNYSITKNIQHELYYFKNRMKCMTGN
ncbi:beta-1,4 N-acetylgalactosaminyltransferase 1 [Gastrophryne carolinensis]